MNNYGFTEQEARIFILLDKAEDLLDELMRARYPDEDGGGLLAHIVWTETHTHEHFNALRRHLGLSILRRNYPKGWGYIPPEDENEDP